MKCTNIVIIEATPLTELLNLARLLSNLEGFSRSGRHTVGMRGEKWTDLEEKWTTAWRAAGTDQELGITESPNSYLAIILGLFHSVSASNFCEIPYA